MNYTLKMSEEMYHQCNERIQNLDMEQEKCNHIVSLSIWF